MTDPVLPIALELLACLETAAGELDNPPQHTMLRPGAQIELLIAQARDECCEGLGWVRPVTVFPSAHFPDPDPTAVPGYPIQYVAVFELGVVRCAPMEDAQAIPSADNWNSVTAAVLADASAMRRALCCWTDSNEDTLFAIGPWLPLQTEGGCVGGIQTITIAVGPCDCDDTEEP